MYTLIKAANDLGFVWVVANLDEAKSFVKKHLGLNPTAKKGENPDSFLIKYLSNPTIANPKGFYLDEAQNA